MSSPAFVASPYLAVARELETNPDQWKAYQSKGHCVVLAGPGSGKTKVLTVKLAQLIAEEVSPPRGVACVTFNNECVRELTHRLARLGVSHSDNVFVGTVHSFCMKHILRPYARLGGIDLPPTWRVATTSDSSRLFSAAVNRTISMNEKPSDWRPKCDIYRKRHLDRDSPDWTGQDSQLATLIEEYERLLRADGLIDFDDMVLLGLRLVESQPWVRKVLAARFPVLVVDEYQDLGRALHRLVTSLCFGPAPGSRLFAVGDPDQTVYSFAGANPELLRNLASDERVESVQLRLNYRSRANIVSASEVALGEERGYVAAGGDGGVIDFHECDEGISAQANFACSDLIPSVLERGAARNYGEVALLYRDKRQGDAIAEQVAAAGYPFLRVDKNAPYPSTPLTTWLEQCAKWCAGGWELGQPPLSDLASRWRSMTPSVTSDRARQVHRRRLARFLFDHRDPARPLSEWLGEFLGACLTPAFEDEPGLCDEAERVEAIHALCSPANKLSDWTVAQFGGQDGSPTHLNMMTFHSAKGLEFDVVLMIGVERGIIPYRSESSPEAKRDARRLFYVGLTRARYEVHMLYSKSREGAYGRREGGPSEFVEEIQAAMPST